MPEQDLKVRHRIYYAQTLAYVLIIAVTGLFFWHETKNTEELCKSSYENREAIQLLTREISDLGEDLVLGDVPKGRMTDEQRQAVEEFETFEREVISQLPLPVC